MNTTEDKIETTLHSLDTIQRLEVPFVLKKSITENFNTKNFPVVTSFQKWMIAASIIVLLGVNLVTIVQYSKSSKNYSSNNDKNVVYKEYFSSEY
ncbi:MAG: hypothetical protein K2P85_12570 [Flavobacteriaceae bacterium]|nr:hypothetical protein [Flavobacteriaceae bacterium]